MAGHRSMGTRVQGTIPGPNVVTQQLPPPDPAKAEAMRVARNLEISLMRRGVRASRARRQATIIGHIVRHIRSGKAWPPRRRP